MSDDIEYDDNILDFPGAAHNEGERPWFLYDIVLIGSSYEFNEENITGEEGIETDIPFTAELESVDGELVKILHDYDLSLKTEGGSSVILRITARFRVYYHPEEPLDQEVLTALQEAPRMMDTWPYFRAHVQSTVGRSGMPPVPMPW